MTVRFSSQLKSTVDILKRKNGERLGYIRSHVAARGLAAEIDYGFPPNVRIAMVNIPSFLARIFGQRIECLIEVDNFNSYKAYGGGYFKEAQDLLNGRKIEELEEGELAQFVVHLEKANSLILGKGNKASLYKWLGEIALLTGKKNRGCGMF